MSESGNAALARLGAGPYKGAASLAFYRKSFALWRQEFKFWPQVLTTKAQVAQLVEHATENRSVAGSIPALGTILLNDLVDHAASEFMRTAVARDAVLGRCVKQLA